jgi:hypothetical protein
MDWKNPSLLLPKTATATTTSESSFKSLFQFTSRANGSGRRRASALSGGGKSPLVEQTGAEKSYQVKPQATILMIMSVKLSRKNH